jgi:hypothetical protein
LVDAAASFYALREAIGGPIAAASEFESAMADVLSRRDARRGARRPQGPCARG